MYASSSSTVTATPGRLFDLFIMVPKICVIFERFLYVSHFKNIFIRIRFGFEILSLSI